MYLRNLLYCFFLFSCLNLFAEREIYPYALSPERASDFQMALELSAAKKSKDALPIWKELMNTTPIQTPDSIAFLAYIHYLDHFIVNQLKIDSIGGELERFKELSLSSSDYNYWMKFFHFQYVLNRTKGDYVSALNYLDSIEINTAVATGKSPSAKTNEWMFKASQGRGFVMAQLEELHNSLARYKKSLDYVDDNTDPFSKVRAYMNIAVTYNEINKLNRDTFLEDGKIYLAMANELCQEQYVPTICEMVVINIAALYFDNEDYQKAINYLNENITINIDDVLPTVRFSYWGTLGKSFSKLGSHELAIFYLEKALDLTEASNKYFYSLDMLGYAVESTEQLGEFQRALEFQKRKEIIQEKINQKGIQDRISKADQQRILAEKREEISALERDNQKIDNARLRLLITAISLIALMGFLTFFVYLKLTKHEKEKAALQKKIVASKLQALSLNMNPHFIFNSFNTLLNFILKNDTNNAVEYLSKMADIIRHLLDNAENVSIPFNKEMEILNSYIHLEKSRFDYELNFEFKIDDELIKENPLVPSMVLQPHLENAIVHGLRTKESGGKLLLEIKKTENWIDCIIKDNGIGRVASSKIVDKIDHLNIATDNTKERMSLLENMGYNGCKIDIKDLYTPQGEPNGTEVVIRLPIIKKITKAA